MFGLGVGFGKIGFGKGSGYEGGPVVFCVVCVLCCVVLCCVVLCCVVLCCVVCVFLCFCVFVLFIVCVSIALMQQVSEMESHSVQLEKMEKEFLGKAKMEIQKHPEMAKLLGQELAFEQDEQLQGRFPINQISETDDAEQFKIANELDAQMGWGPWSYGDPMRLSFDFKMVYELGKLQQDG